jgi:hypothetical protein
MFNLMRSAMLAGTVLIGSAVVANAFIVTFEDKTGPPADETSVYGTESCCNSNPLTISFSAPVTNFFLDILNGNTIDETYTIAITWVTRPAS